MKKLILIFILISLPFVTASALTKEASQIQLDKTKASIAAVTQQQKSEFKELSDLEGALKKTDANLADIAKKRQDFITRLSDSEKKLSDLQKQLEVLDTDAQKLQKEWINTFRLHYKLGAQPALSLLFSNQSFHERLRNLHFLQIIFKSEQSSLKLLAQKKIEIATTSNNVLQEQQELAELKNSLELQNLQLSQAKRQQNTMILSRKASIKKSKSELASLQLNEKQLKQLIAQMEAAAAAAKKSQHQSENENAKNQIEYSNSPSHYPVQGKITARFGQRSNQNLIVSKGIFIAAKEGAPVTSPKNGTVIFSDWLRGYGYLIIVDHGNHYLSLYGHNQNLLKKKQDTVKAGEIIARVGRSGGSEQAGLYFEVRRQGEPINPERWMKDNS